MLYTPIKPAITYLLYYYTIKYKYICLQHCIIADRQVIYLKRAYFQTLNIL